jgi:O-acetylhomoserine (thiol)-lyase
MNEQNTERREKAETTVLHGGYNPQGAAGSRAVPLYRTTAYTFQDTEHASRLFDLAEDGFIYTRIGNPTQQVLEDRLALLEGGVAAVALASGTAAVFYSIINLARAGDEIVATEKLYGGSHTLFTSILPDLGIKVKLIPVNDIAALQGAISDKTRAVYTEIIGNPGLDVADIPALAEAAHAAGLPLLVDSTFATPILCRPLELGADIVIHSLTKWIGGHGTVMGGAVIDGGTFDWTGGKHPLFTEKDESYHGIRWGHDLGDKQPAAFAIRLRTVPLRNIGAAISPDNAWEILQGMESLPLRMERHSSNAAAVADYLADHPKVEWVRYPGLVKDPFRKVADRVLTKLFPEKGSCGESGTVSKSAPYGGMVVFGIKGGIEAGRRFIEKLELISHLANVGDTRSLAIHPGSTTHSQLSEEDQIAAGVKPELIRLSVGIEHVDDILQDLGQALQEV